MFNLAIDSKLRGCDLVNLRVRGITHGNQIGYPDYRVDSISPASSLSDLSSSDGRISRSGKNRSVSG